MSSTPFGEHLKREREMRGVSIEEIAAATRINTRYLEAIEKERWDQLPGGVFNRGFIRSIARFLGMDEDSLVAEYDLDAKNNGHSHHAVAPPATQMQRNWQQAALSIVALVIFIAAGAFACINYRTMISAGLHRGVSIVAMGVHRIRTKPGTGPTAAKLPSTDAPSASIRRDSAAAAVSPSASANSAPLTLKLEAGKDANVKVIADGTVVFEGPVRVDDVKQFQARDKFEVASSESSALLLELDGQTVPPIGTPGQPGSVTLTRSDLAAPAGDSH